MNEPDDVPLFCHRCGAQLTCGEGNFYVVRIEAFADPTPPKIETGQSSELDANAEFSRLIEQMRDFSEQELMDQVHRRLIIHLCGRCYRRWIEDPTG